jgi:phi13 family phage major tail protein
MAREIGISKLHFFPLTKDEQGDDPTWGAAYAVPWAVNFQTSAEYAESEYYADNIIENSQKQLTKYTVTMEVSSDTPPSLEAKITGKTTVLGGAVTTSDDTAPKHAIAYEIKMDDGSLRRKVLYNSTLYKTSSENATQEESIDGKTFTYEGTSTPLVSIKAIELVLDSKEIDAISDPSNKQKAKTVWDNFFTNVALPSDLA